ncbi:MAG: hypothetical protein Q8O82_00435 [Pseudorhodobacter sp.]|nr:hypothetical protein [Pseudorhodobacter sp.]
MAVIQYQVTAQGLLSDDQTRLLLVGRSLVEPARISADTDACRAIGQKGSRAMTPSQAPPFGNSAGKRFATTVAIAAIALGLLTAAAVPAHADKNSDNVAGILAGIAAVAIIANVLDNTKHSAVNESAPTVTHLSVLPANCALWIEGQDRNHAIYSERCLKQRGYIYNLPGNCAHNARIFGRDDRIFTARCLADAGFGIDYWQGWH